ncbi:MAG: HAMP domain-containing sensor histidine kinase [Synergistaceae bacterium]
MKRSLKTQLTIQYMIIVIICMLVIPLGITKILDVQFKRYIEERVQASRDDVLVFLQELYTKGNNWDRAAMELINHEFMPWPIFRATVYDVNDNVVFDVTKRKEKKRRHKMDEPRFDKKVLALEDKIYIGDTYIGKVRFYCIPFKDRPESAFLIRFKKMLYKSMALMLLLSAGLALYMTKRIEDPLSKVTKRAYDISNGKYKIKEEMNSNITEIQTLIDSIDRLGMGLDEQNRLRKRLMGDIAHELRNPIAIVKSHLEAFADGVWQATPERINLTVEEIDRLSRLITEVEKLEILEAENTRILKENTDLSNELEKTVTAYMPLFKAKNVTLTSDIQSGIIANIDMQKMRQVFENLLSNALRYTDSMREVKLSLKKENNFNVIRVEDSGIGISDKDLPNIFERFYRADKSRARASGGMGIGLTLAKATVKAHNGEILVESREGEGSLFTVKLPA